MSYAAEFFIRFGPETSVAYTSGEFRGKDGQLRVPVEVGIGYICGKRNKLRNVPIASWVKALVDSWTTAAGIRRG